MRRPALVTISGVMSAAVVASVVGVSLLASPGAFAAGGATQGPHRYVYVTEAEVPVADPAPAGGVDSCDPRPTWCRNVVNTGSVMFEADGTISNEASLRFTTPGPDDKATASTGQAAGIRLIDVKTLGYSTRTNGPATPSGLLVPSLVLQVQTGDPTTPYATLAFDPHRIRAGAAIVSGRWQGWDSTLAANAGWWSSKLDSGNSKSLDQMKAAFPNATLTRLGVSQGNGQAGAVADADRVFINETTYDFVTTAPAGTTATVQQGDIHPNSEDSCPPVTWCLTKAGTSSAAEVVADATAEGQSALEFRTPASADSAKVFTTAYRGLEVAKLLTLAYQTSRDRSSTGSAGVVPALKILVSTGLTNPAYATLVWEPANSDAGYNATADDVWQQWVPSTAHGWWSTRNSAPGGSIGALGFRQYSASWAEVQAALPDAVVQTVGIGQGSANPGLIGRSDVLRINRDAYDFQSGAGIPSPTPTPTGTAAPTAAASSSPSATTTQTTAASSSPSGSASATATLSPSQTPSASRSSTAPPSATPTNTATTTPAGTASPTGTASAVPTASATQSADSSAPEPSATQHPSATPRQRVGLSLRVSTPSVPAGATARLEGTGQPNAGYELRCYTRPSQTYETARTGTFDSAGSSVVFTLKVGRNTRCFLQYSVDPGHGAAPSVVVNVRTVLSLSAVRTAAGTYTFQGRNLPRATGQLITLYRLDGTGNEIRTSTLRTDGSGIFSVTRRFTGGGTFAFKVRTSETLNNTAGLSNTITVNVR